jgi:predicted metalloprotease with PDZ domain
VIKSLEEIAPYDWRGFFTKRLTSTEVHAPLAGLEAAGWRLVYTDVIPDTLKARGGFDMSYSLGCWLSKEGNIVEVMPQSPVAKAGLVGGMRVLAVNGRRFSEESLRNALKNSAKEKGKIDLLIENGDEFKTYSVDYHDGEKYPNLERDNNRPDVLSQIIKPVGGNQVK